MPIKDFMILNLKCQYCSESKEIECDITHSASRRIEIAKQHDWHAHRAGNNGIPLYFCSESCEHKFRVQKKTHLHIVGRVTR